MNKHELAVPNLSQKRLMLKDISSARVGRGNRLTQHVAEVVLVWHSSSHFLVLSKRSQNYSEL